MAARLSHTERDIVELQRDLEAREEAETREAHDREAEPVG